MKFDVISLLPEIINAGLQSGVVGSAFKKGLCDLNLINPRNFTTDVHQSVDDRPFGGSDGMLMMAEPLQKALDSVEQKGPVILFSPTGQTLTDSKVRDLATSSQITLICGRYAGVDQRFVVANPIVEVSIGDYVISGGELAALVFMDAVVRQIPGVLGHAQSAQEDSFARKLLECPQFTRPQEWKGYGVPPILRSGDHKKMDHYRSTVSLILTLLRRPDLLHGQSIMWSTVKKDFKTFSLEDLRPLGLLQWVSEDKVDTLSSELLEQKQEFLKLIKERLS